MIFNHEKLLAAVGEMNAGELAYQLSNLMGRRIPMPTVRNWMAGENVPSGDMMAGLCALTRKPIGFFFDAPVHAKYTHRRKASAKAARA